MDNGGDGGGWGAEVVVCLKVKQPKLVLRLVCANSSSNV